MAPISEYTLEQLQFAASAMKGLLRPERDEDARLVQKGLMLYRQGLVFGTRFDGDMVSASVQDVVPVTVGIDLSFLETSECSCPGEGFCRHIMAVFFQALSQAGSVSAWVEDWRRPLREKKLATDLGLKTARDLLKSSSRFDDEGDYDSWDEGFAESFRAIMLRRGEPQVYVVGDLFRVYWRKVKADAPVKLEWRIIYELAAAVRSFVLLGELVEDLGHPEYYVDRYFQPLFGTIVDDAESAMGRLSFQSLPFALDGFLERLQEDAVELLRVPKAIEYEGIHFYRLLWGQVFRKAAWLEPEMDRLGVMLVEDEAERVRFQSMMADDEAGLAEACELRRVAEEMRDGAVDDGFSVVLQLVGGDEFSESLADRVVSKMFDRGHLPVVVGLLHLLVVAKRDEEALALLARVDETVVPYLLHVLEEGLEQKELRRLGPYIDYFLSRLHDYLERLGEYRACADFTMLAMDLLSRYCTEAGRFELLEKTLTQTLPYSYQEYDAYLFEKGDYDRWVELQSFVGVGMSYLATADLKEVQKEEPEALLPFYHQAVAGLIEMKNRSSYREAVRLMKKLRTIYKKLKRVEEWEQYLELIMFQTKRLRAFHEELQRGKLV